MAPKLTPMMKQYLQIKEQYRDCILFYRMGDFYEMFFDDAEEASKILGIALTSRNKTDKDQIPMCGVPFHAAENYLQKLLLEGKKVAICEQVEDPKTAKGVVKREVVRVVTPGTNTLEEDRPGGTYLASLFRAKEFFGFAYLDLSTGLFRATALSNEEVNQELGRVNPTELLLPSGEKIKTGAIVTELPKSRFNEGDAKKLLREPLIDKRFEIGLNAAGALLWYLKETQKETPIDHLSAIEVYAPNRFLILDPTTIRNLELFQTQNGNSKKGTLFSILNECMTKMGERFLRQSLQYPLKVCGEINRRLNQVELFFQKDRLRDEVRQELKKVKDIDRLLSRVIMGLANARDILALGQSLNILPTLRELLSQHEGFSGLLMEWNDLKKISDLIEKGIHHEPPLTIREGGIIREGYSEELDELLTLSREGKHFLSEFETRERERTRIPLKVRFNNVFGYYIEITKSHINKVPDDYQRRQTLVNAERYITPELKEYEDRILNSEDRRKSLEYELFQEIRGKISSTGDAIQKMARLLAHLDFVSSLAELARRNGYVRPVVNEEDGINIIQGRHPVIEKMTLGEAFVPNDITLDNRDARMLIITGPNMAGKSTVMRQVALIVLLAQVGSFVPSASATIGMVDQIFTRVGASDRLSQGESTFMVEMVETANILKRATSKSLIILDEIGRGTSTFDGVSIAWAVAEMIDKEVGAKTLFATHYHELTALADEYPKIKNFQIAVKEWKSEIIFLRQLISGATSRSYGIEVGRLAGLPDQVVKRAREVLKELESVRENVEGCNDKDNTQLTLFQISQHPVLKELEEINVSNLTPIEALNRLYDLQNRL